MRRRLILAIVVLLPLIGCTASDWLNVFTNSAQNSDQYQMSRMNKGNTAVTTPNNSP